MTWNRDAERRRVWRRGTGALWLAPLVFLLSGCHARRPAAPLTAAGVEQVAMGAADAPALVESFEGLGNGFTGPQGRAALRNPSDNTLAVGRDHIVQVVNTRLAIFSRRGARFDSTGRVLYGPVPTNTLFHGAGGACGRRNSGDAVARYDQLADRWLVVIPVFQRSEWHADDPEPPAPGGPARLSQPFRADQPGPAVPLFVPAPAIDTLGPRPPAPRDSGTYAMCYAVSATADPTGAWYRYEFIRPLFPDYPRPAVWPDGYYVPTSTGDDVIEKHACVVDRARMLRGEPATEQCVVISGVNFLNNVDLDGPTLPPAGAPNIMLAAGGTQLRGQLTDSVLHAWSFHVDWNDVTQTRVSGPVPIAVAPYRYLCGGQLTNCVPQPGVERRLDAQGDKLMARVVYRRIGNRESIVAVHSVDTESRGGGVRWYELRVNADRTLHVAQQGTFAPDSGFRWLGSPAIDRFGDIGIGYSFGSATAAPGQRFAGRRAGDPRGRLTLREQVLVHGAGSQSGTLRWEDYTQTAIDPRDDCTIWYVGDYLAAGATSYSSRIGAFRLPACARAAVRAR
ncbi:MAG: hypothetical protein IT355_07690 [Gemmatimonadaceae bacterium]|nr:hypothetical protein [Gemmatimonadaceae bacterium]